MKIRTILTDNGKEFTDQVFGQEPKDATGSHEFDALCQALGIEHRLTKPKSPRTNGMVERFNGRLAQILRTHHFQSSLDLKTTLHRYAWLYNEHHPQKSLNHQTPLQALKTWQQSHPHLFQKAVRNHAGPDTRRREAVRGHFREGSLPHRSGRSDPAGLSLATDRGHPAAVGRGH
ncbi:protein of unknown function [Methylacidimicrobium sp. AP8]|nr:protein of unknown function [Methylacidimicrobium sp. AP8]